MTNQREENGETVKNLDRAPEGNGSKHNSEVCVSGVVKCHRMGGARVCTLTFSHRRLESTNKWAGGWGT